MKKFITVVLFIDNALLLSLTIYNYIQSSIAKDKLNSEAWLNGIYLSIALLILLLLSLLTARKKKWRKTQRRK